MPIAYTFNPPNDQAIRDAAETTVFGAPLGGANNDVYADLAGDLMRTGTLQVIFNRLYARNNKVYPITIYAKLGTHNTSIRLNRNEFNYSECSMVTKNNQLGRLVMLKVAKTARERHFQRIDVDAIRDDSPAHPAWGYSVSPTYGFDQAMPPGVVLPPPLAHFTRVLALNNDPAGRAFWKVNGARCPDMEFDLTDGSPSWQRLRVLSLPY